MVFWNRKKKQNRAAQPSPAPRQRRKLVSGARCRPSHCPIAFTGMGLRNTMRNIVAMSLLLVACMLAREASVRLIAMMTPIAVLVVIVKTANVTPECIRR